MSNPQVQGDTEVAIDVELSNKNFCLDDPKQRQHYTKYMTAEGKREICEILCSLALRDEGGGSLVSADDQSIAPQNL